MSISGYLLNADDDQVNAFNEAAMDAIGFHLGLVLAPTSSTRAYIPVDLLKEVRTALGKNGFQKLLKSTRITFLSAVDEATAQSLIETRDPADIADRPKLEQPPRKEPTTGKSLDWHLVETGISAAWLLLGGPDHIQWGDVVVGHIDTGFTRHPALGFKADDEVSGWIDTHKDRNFFEREVFPPEGDTQFATFDSALDTLGGFSGGHGTRTMSVLCGFSEAATAKKSGTYAGYYGAAPKVPVIPVRVEDCIWLQAALYYGLPTTIDHLVKEGVSVISMSMGAPKFAAGTVSLPKPLRDSIDNAYKKGVIFCCAAGNHVPNEVVIFPARSPRTIAVGGSAPGLTPWGGSSYGVDVDISAPAFPIRRASTRRGNKYEYGIGDGTSFATPQVAATAAMWLVHRRADISLKYPEPWQRVAAFLQILRSTATPGNKWNTNTHGPGVLNAVGVLNAPLPDRDSLNKETSAHE